MKKHTIQHGLDQDTARRVAEKAWASYQERFSEYHPTIQWDRPDHASVGFKAMGTSLKGALTLKPGEIEMELDVPFLLKPFQGKALSVITEEVQKWVTEAKAGKI